MSGLYVPTQMVQNARSWVGYHEGPNNANPFSQWQYGSAKQPYCDSFVCYCAWQAGFRFPPYSAHGERGDSWVTGHRMHAQTQGIWRNRATSARAGWLVVFSFTLPDQHIEMVLSDQGGPTFATVGGNTGDMVAYRIRHRENVVGFIALDEAGQNLANPIPPPVPFQQSEDPMLFKPPTGDVTLNRFSGTQVRMSDSHIGTTGDCHISPDPATVVIKHPFAGAHGPDQDPKLQPGQFIVVGADMAEYKFTLSRA